MNILNWKIIVALFICFNIISCEFEILKQPFKSKSVIVVIIDGARYCECWGDTSHQNIPRMGNQLSKLGVVYTQFYNRGGTYTNAGHTAITTGIYQEINNGGLEFPQNPSIFQCWNKEYSNEQTKSWVITSKDKLAILGNCENKQWKNTFIPSVNSGINGLGSGYRHDSLTIKKTLEILAEHHPQLVLINFREPDYSGHSGVWANYIQGIKSSDEYAFQIWKFLQSDPFYRDNATLIITNDHGRHSDGVADGFASHGDNCDGCRHVGFFACGPDIKQDVVINTLREQIDLPVTIAYILGFELTMSEGRIMSEIFK